MVGHYLPHSDPIPQDLPSSPGGQGSWLHDLVVPGRRTSFPDHTAARRLNDTLVG